MEWVGFTTCGFSQSPKWSLTKVVNSDDLKLILTHSLMRISCCTLWLVHLFHFGSHRFDRRSSCMVWNHRKEAHIELEILGHSHEHKTGEIEPELWAQHGKVVSKPPLPWAELLKVLTRVLRLDRADMDLVMPASKGDLAMGITCWCRD